MTLVLASISQSRQAMLHQTGVEFRVQPADLDERELEAAMRDSGPQQVVLALAEAKALAAQGSGALVLGSDSLVSVEGERFDKPTSREEAQAHLRFFSGREMELHSAAALARGSQIVWSHGEVARLRVRTLSDSFIEAYLDAEWPAVAGCVGVFRIEAMGAHLFESIEGSHFTVLGMPLLAVLAALRDLGEVAS
ncbi:MAG: Maf-like protein [Alphaproteobacteria bacterium]|nr:Maf-like protein [Alphaproteobacteria bacterium]